MGGALTTVYDPNRGALGHAAQLQGRRRLPRRQPPAGALRVRLVVPPDAPRAGVHRRPGEAAQPPERGVQRGRSGQVPARRPTEFISRALVLLLRSFSSSQTP